MMRESEKKLISHIKLNLIKNSKKIKSHFFSISEHVGKSSKILRVKAIYEITEKLLLVWAKNHLKAPKFRFFLAATLANQSSDYLVNIARNLPQFRKDFKLIQYPLYSQYHRVGLLLLNEIQREEDIANSIILLKEFREQFRKKIENP